MRLELYTAGKEGYKALEMLHLDI